MPKKKKSISSLQGSKCDTSLNFEFFMCHWTTLGANSRSTMLAIKKNLNSSSSPKWHPSLNSGSSCPTKLFMAPRIAQQQVQNFKKLEFKLGFRMGPKFEFLMHYRTTLSAKSNSIVPTK